MSLPDVPPLELIKERLPLIFPEGTEHRNYVIREMAAKTLYVMFYTGAVGGLGRWVRPSQITDMSDGQAVKLDEADREAWTVESLSSKKTRPLDTWYAANSREPVRDETIRLGFIQFNAVIERSGLPTTSSKPKYALEKGFAELFDPDLSGKALEEKIEAWRETHLSAGAVARVKLVRRGAVRSKDAVSVMFPDGSSRAMKPGASSVISKAVIEEYAPRFLKNPVVLWLSESGNKVVARDDDLAQSLNLHIDQAKALPDVILVDLGDDHNPASLLIVFVEVVASDGPVNDLRQRTFTDLAVKAGFKEEQLRFLTAYSDRGDQMFRKTVSNLAWRSAAWFASEPDKIVIFAHRTGIDRVV
ncbi:BsuBI/PstI family type II restriction endonuclease [Oleiagrimonas sp. MCCC 1A03011]|uniref:BsuBI/PstI family type II restriction endonuclease n=1 Tax=Oleiagrimonas sp. MCCC 1A03011 TaxID=1926883 RepID=UPI000DC35A57|nr:BsuBI/PstI family type II restriction endonuclease [Oleiagrimonas sp. MCCC 1A03011]RAP59668.1 restriction endonuclease [Oleiagrimonas sp. MCCC 1A03011]